MSAYRPVLRFLKSVEVAFNPWMDGTRGAREFYRQISNAKMRSANPRCDVRVRMLEETDRTPAAIALEYADGSRQEIEANDRPVAQLMDEIDGFIFDQEMAFIRAGKSRAEMTEG